MKDKVSPENFCWGGKVLSIKSGTIFSHNTLQIKAQNRELKKHTQTSTQAWKEKLPTAKKFMDMKIIHLWYDLKLH